MIDEKKIEEAANLHMEEVRDIYRDDVFGVSYPTESKDIEGQIMDDFTDGAHWAANEFEKSLWHDAQEKPQDDVDLLLEEFLYNNNNSNVMYYAIYNHDESLESWNVFANRQRVIRWLYIDDLVKTVK